MKNLFNKNNVITASAFLVVVIATSMISPAVTHANPPGYGYDYGYRSPASYCSYPMVASVAGNGNFYCTYPNQTPPPVIIQQPPVYVPPPVYQPPVYVPPVIQYQPLTASCYGTNTGGQNGSSITWTAYASGGQGTYNYTWSSSDGLYGSGQTVYLNYYTPGTKVANLTVYSGGQTINVQCSPVTIYQQYQQYYQQPVVQYQQQYVYGANNNNGLDIGCYTDPTNAYIDQPVSWSVEVTGGVAPYTYSWTGSDGLSAGNQVSVIKYYQSTGAKNALVTVTSADGRSATRACSNTVNVIRRSSGVAPTAPAPVQVVPEQGNQLGANAFFSLNNVPWGWVAILVILVLIAALAYLLFNRPKI